ncbi:MAG: glutathione S-transferase family protein [bacterium]
MLKIYHVPGTRSVRVIWLCEELQVPYEVETISFAQEFRSSPAWRKMNPVGKVPVMTDDALTMFESGAMVQYILDRYGEGQLQPEAGTSEHALYLQWSWFAESTFARPLGEIVNHRRAFAELEQQPAAIEEMQARSLLCMKAVDEAIQGKDFILSEFSAADMMLGYSMMLCERLAPSDEYPDATAYWQRLQQRPGCEIAVNYGL